MDEKSRLSELRFKLECLEDYEMQLKKEYFSFRKRGFFHLFGKTDERSITLKVIGTHYKNSYFITCVISFVFSLYLLFKTSSVVVFHFTQSEVLPILLS